jgi:tetratricopeptide (TPR) repeat protein
MNSAHEDRQSFEQSVLVRIQNKIRNIIQKRFLKVPFSAESYHLRAKRLLMQLKYNEAIEAVNAAIKLAPAYAEAYLTLTYIHLAQGNLNDAITAAELAISLAPSYAEAHHTLAECLYTKGQKQSAILSANAAIALAPDYAEAYFTLGNIFYSLKQLEEAAASFTTAFSMKKDYMEAINHLALVFQDMGRLVEAEELYRKAITLKPDYTNAHNNLGFLLRQLNRPTEAAASFKIAHDLFNPHLVLHQPTAGYKHTWDMIKRYARVSTDIVRWGIKCGVRPNAWVDYQLLNQATNGISGDKFSAVLRGLSKKGKLLPEWRESAIFPWMSSQDIPAILQTLDRDGIYIFDQLVATDFLDEVYNYAMSTETTLYAPLVTSKTRAVKMRALFNPDAPLASGYYIDESKMLNQAVFQRFAGDPLLLAITQAYLGVEPKLNELTCWWSTVFSRNPSSDMAQLYHADLSHMKWLNFYIYITDVTEDTGPHSFVRGSHKPDNEGKELRRRGVVRVSDEEICNAYGQERVVNVIGRRGTAFIADTRAFHKGCRPLAGHRLILQMNLVNSLYPDIGKKKWDLIAKDAALIETLCRHPKMFAGYSIQFQN